MSGMKERWNIIDMKCISSMGLGDIFSSAKVDPSRSDLHTRPCNHCRGKFGTEYVLRRIETRASSCEFCPWMARRTRVSRVPRAPAGLGQWFPKQPSVSTQSQIDAAILAISGRGNSNVEKYGKCML